MIPDSAFSCGLIVLMGGLTIYQAKPQPSHQATNVHGVHENIPDYLRRKFKEIHGYEIVSMYGELRKLMSRQPYEVHFHGASDPASRSRKHQITMLWGTV